MKTNKIFSLLFALAVSAIFLSMPVMASTPVAECAATIWTRIQNDVKYPDPALTQEVEGSVTVIFTVSDEGKVIIKNIFGTDQALITYVRNKMTSKEYPELVNASVYDFRVKFTFKLL